MIKSDLRVLTPRGHGDCILMYFLPFFTVTTFIHLIVFVHAVRCLAPLSITPRPLWYLLSLYPFCQTPPSGYSISALLGFQRHGPEVIESPCICMVCKVCMCLFILQTLSSPPFRGPFVIAAVPGTDICVYLELHLQLFHVCIPLIHL